MEQNNKKTQTLEQISSMLVISSGALIPLFFLATTTEFYEFNKLALLALISLLLTVLWGIKMFFGSKIQFVKSSLDLPIIINTAVFLLATLFSIDKTSSIWGSQGRWFPSLFGVLTLIVFFYMSAPSLTNLKAIRMSVISLIFGSTLATLIATLNYFGVNLESTPYIAVAGFTPAGSITSTMLLAATAFILSLNLGKTTQTRVPKMLLAVAAIINFFYITIAGSVAAWAVLLVGVVLTFTFSRVKEFTKDTFVTVFTAAALAVVILINLLPITKSVLSNKNYPTDLSLPVKESWLISSTSIQDHPLLATGPSTFYIDFTTYRPLSMNNGSAWNIRFDKPYNEVLNVLGTTGIIGLLAAIYLAARVFRFAFHVSSVRDESGIVKGIAAALLAMGVSLIFSYATVVSMFVLVYLAVLLLATYALSTENRKHGETVTFSFASFSATTTTIGEVSAVGKQYANVIAIAPLIAGVAFGGFLFGKVYLGEYYMRQSLVAASENRAVDTYNFQGKAVNINTRKDTYRTAYAQTNLVLANILAAKQDLTDQDKQTIQTLISQSIQSTRIATETLNPANVANWQTRAVIYRSLLNVAQNAQDWTISAYNNAIQLDPTNPALRIDLGGVYYAAKDYLSAANLFRQATSLKADYANAHYNFAEALLQLKDPANAKRELETVKTLVPADSDDFKKVNEEIATIDKQQPAVAGAATAKPTVEQLSGTTPPTTAQEPLSAPAQPTTDQNINTQALPTPAK